MAREDVSYWASCRPGVCCPCQVADTISCAACPWSVGRLGAAIEHVRAVAAAELALYPVVTAQPTDLHHLAPQLQELTTAARQLEADTLWPLMVRLAGLEAAPICQPACVAVHWKRHQLLATAHVSEQGCGAEPAHLCVSWAAAETAEVTRVNHAADCQQRFWLVATAQLQHT